METLIQFLKMLAKLALILIGGLLLFGGGACALIGLGNLGQGGGMLGMIAIAIVVALVGFALIKIAVGSKDGRG
jgi:hypothetical protein